MKIWFDALTSKQALLMLSLARKFRSKGFETIITCRKYEYVESLLTLFRENHFCVGEYGGGTLEGKLVADIKRMRELIEFVKKEKPAFLISYPSPSAVRIAFGLKIPIILMTDTPHAEEVSRLTIPLANYVIYSKCIRKELIRKYMLSDYTKEITYNGIDELEWIGDDYINTFNKEETINELGLVGKEKVIIYRPEEEKATYYKYRPLYKEVLARLSKLNIPIIFLPRYESQKRHASKIRNVIVPEKAINIRCLFQKTLAVISGGASLAREAALYGIPSLTYFPEELDVNRCVIEWGFPLYHAREVHEIMEFINKVVKGEIGAKGNFNKLRSLEKPSDAIFKIIEEYL